MDFFENGLSLLCQKYINETYRLKSFHETIEGIWTKRGNELELKMKSDIDESPEQDHQDIGENFYHDYIEKVIKYEFLHRQSIVITACSMIESALYKLCELTSTVSGNKFDLTKDKSQESKIKKCISYLSKIEQFNMNLLNEEIDRIHNLYKVRNEIVHNNGVLSKKLQKLNIPKLKGSIGGIIEIEFDFLDFYLEILKTFFEKLKCQVSQFISKYS